MACGFWPDNLNTHRVQFNVWCNSNKNMLHARCVVCHICSNCLLEESDVGAMKLWSSSSEMVTCHNTTALAHEQLLVQATCWKSDQKISKIASAMTHLWSFRVVIQVGLFCSSISGSMALACFSAASVMYGHMRAATIQR